MGSRPRSVVSGGRHVGELNSAAGGVYSSVSGAISDKSKGRLRSIAVSLRKQMSELLIPVGFIVLWVVLNRWVLPRFGVPT
jgi:hypothetical protein